MFSSIRVVMVIASLHSNWALTKMGAGGQVFCSNFSQNSCNIGVKWEDRNGEKSQISFTLCFCLWWRMNDFRYGWTSAPFVPFLFCRSLKACLLPIFPKHALSAFISHFKVYSHLHWTHCETLYMHKVQSYPGKHSFSTTKFIMETDFFTLMVSLLMTGVES